MSIKILRKGLHDSFRDIGRHGLRRLGVNVSGAEDPVAFEIGATLLGNSTDNAALEFFFPAPKIEFTEACSIVITGGDFKPALNGLSLANNQVTDVKRGSKLEFLGVSFGKVGYLSVAGGFRLERWHKSESTNTFAKVGGFEGRLLETGDLIKLKGARLVEQKLRSGGFVDYSENTLSFIPAVDLESITASSELELLTEEFTISAESNRMGIRLFGPSLSLLDNESRLSSGVDHGSIQLLPDGSLTILGSDHQTTGGYPLLGTLTKESISVLSQKLPGETVKFRVIGQKDAIRASQELEQDFSFLRTAIGLHKN